MEARASRLAFVTLGFWLCALMVTGCLGQSSFDSPDIPTKFSLDLQTAAKLRPQMLAQSVAASGRFASGALVLKRLLEQVEAFGATKFDWQLRIVEDDDFNAYASPDGTIYVESGLARLAGSSTGLWAAILSHEVAHVLRRDWARRYLYQKSIEANSGPAILLGDPGVPAASWTDSSKASQDLGRFCRKLEVDADRAGLMLMARAGYHPDFVPALHHLLHAQASGNEPASIYAMHPCWEERDRELSQAYVAASIEFAHRWTEWYSSPGGNPPILVFADEPTVKKNKSNEWEIQVPMHCQNLVGAVEVVLRSPSTPGNDNPAPSENEIRQLTGCTSPRTIVTFVLTDPARRRSRQLANVYVLDGRGSVLARTDIP